MGHNPTMYYKNFKLFYHKISLFKDSIFVGLETAISFCKRNGSICECRIIKNLMNCNT